MIRPVRMLPSILVFALFCPSCSGVDGSQSIGDTPNGTQAAAERAGIADGFGADALGGDALGEGAVVGPDAMSADPEAEAESCPPPSGLRPMRRSEHAGIYDPIGHQLIIFGGSLGVPVNCSYPTPTFENETWLLDIACGSWRKIEGGPSFGLARHAAVYDSTEHRMLVFGGRYREGTSGNYTLFNSVWAFDLETESWSQVQTNAGPSARINTSVAYDPTNHRLILFGGNSSASGMAYIANDDTWILDLNTNTWSEVFTPSAPSRRLFAPALWDDERQRFVIFGGADETAFFGTVPYFGEIYSLELSGAQGQWTRLDDPALAGPDGRFWASLTHDLERDRYIMFGGHDSLDLGNRNDLWVFYPEDGVWAVQTLGDAYNLPPRGFCDFPPEFTTIDYGSPERRNAHVMAGSEGTAWLTGGKTDCGVIDDVLALDLETLTWSEVETPTVGVGCLRKGGLTCNDYCF